MCDNALWIEGVGWIGQYNSYYETLWEKGVMYFIRDYYTAELKDKLEAGQTYTQVKHLLLRLAAVERCIAERNNLTTERGSQ